MPEQLRNLREVKVTSWKYMNLIEYLELIVEPTFADFCKNPNSGRHAYLSCVATFHAVDRAAAPKKPANLRHKWRKEDFNFLIVDMVAHNFKHVISDFEKQPIPENTIPLHSIIVNRQDRSDTSLGLDLRNLHFQIRDAIKYIRSQAGA